MDSAIWTEKYRPRSFSEIKGQQEVVKRVEAFVKKKNMPHVLFSGPAGVGKTTLSLVIARQLFGESWKSNVLELNASDERGIDVIRNKVKDFARTKALGDVPFKIIYLDECLDYDTEITIRSPEGLIKDIKIGEYIENYDYEGYKVLSVNDDGNKEFVEIKNSIKIPHQEEKGFYKLQIHDKEIKITGNHLVITEEGWKPVEELQRGEKILCPLITELNTEIIPNEPINYNLIALPREIKKKERHIAKSPEKKVIEVLATYSGGLSRQEITKKSQVQTTKLSSILNEKKNRPYVALKPFEIIKKEEGRFRLIDEKNVAISKLSKTKREQNDANYNYIEKELKKKQLFPLDREKGMICARLIGHLFSDGCLSLKAKQLFFSGKEEDMERIKKDINRLGFYKLGNVRCRKWKKGECWSFGAYKIDLLSLFYSLGVPVGKKTDILYKVPEWIMEGSRDIKREFIAALFGGDGTKPAFQGRTIKPIDLRISKRDDLIEDLNDYLQQVQTMLNELGIRSRIKINDKIKTTRKDGTSTKEGRLTILNERQNILKYLIGTGYRYCKYKERLSARTIQYLHWKETLEKDVCAFKPISYFDEWINTQVIGNSAFHHITNIEKIKDPEFVYCLGTENKKFIANDIIVHNCDALTREAQQALRRTMENYTQTCRFILSCNYSSKIIDPIQSRCAIFRFRPLQKEDMLTLIENIGKAEGLDIEKEAMEALYTISEGDCRRMENILQSCAAIQKNIDSNLIYSLASAARPKEIKETLALALDNKFIEARKKLLDVMLNHGLSGQDVIQQIQKEIMNLDLDGRGKMKLIQACGEVEFRMTEGSDEYVQLEALLAQTALVGSQK